MDGAQGLSNQRLQLSRSTAHRKRHERTHGNDAAQRKRGMERIGDNV